MFVLALSLAQWADIAQIVAVLGVGVVAYQVWQGAKSSRVEVITGLTTLITQVDRVFIDYPQMRKYFEDGKAPVGADADQARAVALTMANTLDHVVEHLHLLGERTERAWKIYIGDVHDLSPIFEQVLRDHPRWWPGLQAHLRQRRFQRATATAARRAASSP